VTVGIDEPGAGKLEPESKLDVARLSGLAAAYEVSPQCVVVETEDGRHVRITARRDLSTGLYVSEYERRVSLSNHGHTYQVWAHTPAYEECTAERIEACLEAALEAVAGTHVY